MPPGNLRYRCRVFHGICICCCGRLDRRDFIQAHTLFGPLKRLVTTTRRRWSPIVRILVVLSLPWGSSAAGGVFSSTAFCRLVLWGFLVSTTIHRRSAKNRPYQPAWPTGTLPPRCGPFSRPSSPNAMASGKLVACRTCRPGHFSNNPSPPQVAATGVDHCIQHRLDRHLLFESGTGRKLKRLDRLPQPRNRCQTTAW